MKWLQGYPACVQAVCIVVLLASAHSQTAPELPGADETRHVPENSNLTLACNTTGRADLSDFFWTRGGGGGEGGEVVATGRELEFPDITRNDSAVYICWALDGEAGENVTLNDVDVDVQYPAEVSSMSIVPRVITIRQGDDPRFNVSCNVAGNPPPVWSIFNNVTGRVIRSGNVSSDVVMMGVFAVCGESGTWLCTGYNALSQGVNASRGVPLTVTCSPRPDPDSSPTFNYSSSLGETVSMTLDVASDPAPSYTWSRDDGRPFGNVNIADGPRGTTLEIFDVGIDDFGNYYLTMNNSVGTYETSFSLKAFGTPEAPYNLSVTNIHCDSADLAWTSGYDMGSHEEFVIMHSSESTGEFIQWSDWISEPYANSGVGQVWTYHKDGLDCDTEYEFAVLARNADNVSFSEPVKFNTTGEEPPEDNAQLNKDIIIGCSVGGFLIVAIVFVSYTVWRVKRNSRKSGVSNLAVSLASQNYGSLKEDSNGSGYPIYKRDYLNDSTTLP